MFVNGCGKRRGKREEPFCNLSYSISLNKLDPIQNLLMYGWAVGAVKKLGGQDLKS